MGRFGRLLRPLIPVGWPRPNGGDQSSHRRFLPRRRKLLFEPLESRLLLSADPRILPSPELDPWPSLDEPALVAEVDPSAATVAGSEVKSRDAPDPAGTGLSRGQGLQDPASEKHQVVQGDWRLEALAGDGVPVSVGTLEAVSPVVEEAIARLGSLGVAAEGLEAVRDARVEISDLPGPHLALAEGDRIWIDQDAAGFGWFVDPSPSGDLEFSEVLSDRELGAGEGSPARGQVDLLTVVAHELGHLLGLEHIVSLAQRNGLMESGLRPGVRRLPTFDLDRSVTAQLIETLHVANGPPSGAFDPGSTFRESAPAVPRADESFGLRTDSMILPATELDANVPPEGPAFSMEFDASSALTVVTEVESNDTLATATPLPLEEDPAGGGLFLGRGLGVQDPAGEVDYWRVGAQAGDRLSVSVDTPESGLDTYLWLRNAADQDLATDNNSGPDSDDFISAYTVPTSGAYYIRIGNWWGSAGSYAVRVELARGVQQEADREYANDSLGGANVLTLTPVGNHQRATVAGTVMGPEGSNADEDLFALGVLNAGNVVELTTRLPSTSTLDARVVLLTAAGAAVADEDGDRLDGHTRATLAADGAYYVRVESRWWAYGGHQYLLTSGALTWAQAEAEAQALGGHLVMVNDAAEQQWLWQTFGRFGDLWLGLSDEAVEGA